ncbi:Gfo/Idh/MocA family protein [Sessilibacter sp. MAH2]
MSANTLKLAFIGGGVNSAVGYTHFCASQLDDAWKLVAGAFSSNYPVNEETAFSYGISQDRLYDNWQDLLIAEKNEIDAVVILTPTPIHEEMVISALSLDIPVICEKSLTNDLASSARINSALKKNNGFLSVTYNYSAYPMVRELRTRISRGELGKLMQIQIEMPQEGYIRGGKHAKVSPIQSWRTHDGSIPTIHLDLTCHLHQLIYFLTKLHPVTVRAQENTYGKIDNIVDDASALIEYEQDFFARLWVSKSALGYKNGMSLRIFGDNASAFWEQTSPELLTINYADGRREIIERGSFCYTANAPRYNRFKAGHPSGFIEAFANLYTDFANAIIYRKNHRDSKNHDLDLFSGAYSYGIANEGLELMEAIHKSALNKKTLSMNNPIKPELLELKFG